MKNIKFLILFIAIALINCERDDICPEGTATTPRLFIEFYDVSSPDDLKSVPRLTVYGEGLLQSPPESDVDETIVYDTNANTIELPLKVGTEGEPWVTRFILEKDTNLRDTSGSNEDVIEITYTTEFVYVSRACGYKSIFNTLNVTSEPDDVNWISTIEVVETTVENENTIHVRILH